MKNLGETVVRAAKLEDTSGILRCLADALEPYRMKYTPVTLANTVLDEASLGRRMQRMHVLVALSTDEIAGQAGHTRYDIALGFGD